MAVLILGLVIFLGVHSVRIFAAPWRTAQIERLGKGKWMGFFSLISLLGLVLICVGYGQARQDPIGLWTPPLWTWHITIALTLVAFILLAAAYVPHNAIKAKLKDPMILCVKTWALAHLISNGSLAGVLLFGSFLIWAILDFKACRSRRAEATGSAEPKAEAEVNDPATESALGSASGSTPKSSAAMTSLTVLVAVVAWAVMAQFGHALLIGLSPLKA